MNEIALTLTQELSLVRQARVDGQAFGVLYDYYFPRVYNYVFFRVRERVATDDLVSTIFVRALDRLGTYQEHKGAFGVWLFSIARNAVIDHYRRAARSSVVSLEQVEHLAARAPSVEQSVVERQETEILLERIGHLSEREQEIIGLKFGGGLTNRKIGQLLSLRENHVAVILYRAMRKLRQEFEVGNQQ